MELSWFKKYNLLIFDKIDSTNSEAIRISKSHSKIYNDFIMVSDIQTAGRGSKGRTWETHNGDLTFSILLNDKISPKYHFHVNFLVANVVHDVLKDFFIYYNSKHNIRLKWPNDILVNCKKIGGILIEFVSIGKKNFCIIGLGINIVKPSYPINKFATSLNELGIKLSRDVLLDKIISKFDIEFKQYILGKKKFSLIKKIWLNNAYQLGETVHIWDGKNNVSGIFCTLNDDGSIKLETTKNKFQSILFGDIYDHYLYK